MIWRATDDLVIMNRIISHDYGCALCLSFKKSGNTKSPSILLIGFADDSLQVSLYLKSSYDTQTHVRLINMIKMCSFRVTAFLRVGSQVVRDSK